MKRLNGWTKYLYEDIPEEKITYRISHSPSFNDDSAEGGNFTTQYKVYKYTLIDELTERKSSDDILLYRLTLINQKPHLRETSSSFEFGDGEPYCLRPRINR